MKKHSIKIIILLSFSYIVVSSILSNVNLNFYQVNQIRNIKDEKMNLLKMTGYWNIGPIEIDDDDLLKNWSISAATYNWCSGLGTLSSPYIIENVTINGGGSNNCISILNSNVYFIINNCTLFNSGGTWHSGGIKLENVNNGKIIKNNCSFNENGIYLNSSNNNTLSENIANNNTVNGIFLYEQCNYTKIIGNTANFNAEDPIPGDGIYIEKSYNNLIYNNNVSFNAGRGMDLRTMYNSKIVNNTAIGNGDYPFVGEGITLQSSENITVSSNKVQGNGHGITIYNDKNCIIFNNTAISNKNTGLNVERVINVTITRNNVSHSSTGIYLIGNYVYECYNNTVSENQVKDNNMGICLKGVNNSFVMENSIINNNYGILLTNSFFNIISGNILMGNDICIDEFNCEGNIIENNDCLSGNSNPLIPGYNPFLLIGVILIISSIIIKTQKSKFLKKKLKRDENFSCYLNT